MDKVKAYWAKEFKELANLNHLLGLIEKKAKVLEERWEEHLTKKLKFGRGQMYEDKNVKIIFNTFLRENDPLVDTEVLK